MRDFLGEIWLCLEHVAVARDQKRNDALDVGQRSNPSIFGSKIKAA
jgi:hypothetical protein